MKKRWLILLIILVNLAAVRCPPAEALGPVSDIAKSVVKIFSTTQMANYYQPWQMLQPQEFTGSGVIIEGHRILTNAHVVSDQTYLQVRKAGESKKYKARVEFVAHDGDLALLKVDDPAFWDGASFLPFGPLPQQSDKVVTYGFPVGGDELSITEGTVSRIEVREYAHSAKHLLTIQTDAAINPGNSGGPAIKDGKIVGVAFETLRGQELSNLGYLIPVTMVQRFLKDVEDGTYDGIPELGAHSQNLTNESLRRYYSAPADQTGVLIDRVTEGSSAGGVLQAGDILTSVDGMAISSDRTYVLDGKNRVNLSNLIHMHQIGDKVPIEFLRGGKAQKAELMMRPTSMLVGGRYYDKKPTYFIFGGLVFMPLTWNYVDFWAKEKQARSVLPLFEYLVEYGRPTKERQEIVLLSFVLPDDINEGYHDLGRLIIDSINGRRIARMRDVVEAFRNPVGGYYVIHTDDVMSHGLWIVLDAKKAEEANADILKRQNILSDRSDDLR